MLELILDKEFIDTYSNAYSFDDEYVNDFQNYFILNLQKIKLITNYIDLTDIMNQATLNPILRRILQCTPVIEFRTNLLTYIDSPSFPISGSPFKMILTGEDTATCTIRRKRFGLEYINPENLSDRWQLYYSQRIDINKKTTDDTEIPVTFRFDSWDSFKPFIHPLNYDLIT